MAASPSKSGGLANRIATVCFILFGAAIVVAIVAWIMSMTPEANLPPKPKPFAGLGLLFGKMDFQFDAAFGDIMFAIGDLLVAAVLALFCAVPAALARHRCAAPA